MITVRIIYNDGTEDIKDCLSMDEICLDNVKDIKILREEKVSGFYNVLNAISKKVA